ncbi:Threonine dehydrogenase [Fimbriiglobus ruber]|uniref:Threonine dehydrogenase n=2 Tax=Fimbriiglobus ruber TaxID=1908690 RepID=A0A225E2M3_9BACT|nr:Threonine dehydrogenase [Fimbriiglobus ruber]
MNETDIFFSTNPAEPWSFYPLGSAALALVAAGLIGLTLWTYLGHPQASRRRVALVLALRLVALVVALLTALRPSVGIQEDPKLPSTLLIGIDMSESMTVPDELNNQTRIAAVRKTLDRCSGVLDELRTEQNVNVVMYGFGPADFNEAVHKYDPAAPPKFNKSDYGIYLNKTFERWQGERFVRGHLIIGDGQDNGTGPRPEAEAARWRQAGRQVHTFAVGQPTTDSDAKDVAVKSVSVVSGNPDGSVFIKTDFTLRVVLDARGFDGATVPVEASFDTGDGYKRELVQPTKLISGKEVVVELKLKAPDRPGEIKIKVEVPPASVPGDVAPSNNTIETYLTVTKEGVRVLLVNRLTYEHAFIRNALAADPRIDLYVVTRQTDEPATPQEQEDFDFDNRAYDVIILGNVSARQLQAIDPALPAKIRDQVMKKGVGLLMTGGHATFRGTQGIADAGGWRGVKEITDILPVDLDKTPPVPDTVFTDAGARFQFLPTFQSLNPAGGTQDYLVRLADKPDATAELWNRLNARQSRSRFTGLNRIGTPKSTATLFAVASPETGDHPLPLKPGEERQYAPVLVGHQPGGTGSNGRVLVLAAQDTFLWRRLGLPETNDGIQIHARFWRQMVRWLAHQEDEEGAAFAKPELRRLPLGGKNTIRVGLRQSGGAAAHDPKFDVKVIAPGESEEAARPRTVVPDPDGGFKLTYDPTAAGEYVVKVTATGKDGTGKDVKGEASARFLAYPEASDEMLRKAANPETLKRIATAGGGQFYRLEDLPTFLKDLKAQPLEAVKPRPRYIPDWRRDHSKGFLPGWLVVFVTLLGTEWALRRLWGMV